MDVNKRIQHMLTIHQSANKLHSLLSGAKWYVGTSVTSKDTITVMTKDLTKTGPATFNDWKVVYKLSN